MFGGDDGAEHQAVVDDKSPTCVFNTNRKFIAGEFNTKVHG